VEGCCKTGEDGPDAGQEKIEVINLRNLINETPNVLGEEVRVVFHKEIEIDPMLSTCEKGFSVLQAVNLSMRISPLLHME